jgi:hypothetical protein
MRTVLHRKPKLVFVQLGAITVRRKTVTINSPQFTLAQLRPLG